MSSLVSVVMSVYNTPEAYLRESIESILRQTHTNLEFVVCDDCSAEQTTEILREYEKSDSRFKLIVNDVNLGLPKNLNRAIRMAKGEYVARMDADDVSVPTRLERQLAFLEQYRDVDVLGSDYMLLEKDRLRAPRRRENLPWQIQSRLFFGCQGILHPSVVFRADVFREDGLFYDEEFRVAQDFELWTRVAQTRKIYVLPEPLVRYRVSDVQATKVQSDRLVEFRSKILLRQLSRLGIEPTSEEKTMHLQFALGRQVSCPRALKAWAERLLEANRKLALFEPVAFEYYLRNRQLNSCAHTVTRRGPSLRALLALFDALRLSVKANNAFARESARRGVPYPF